MATRPTVRIVRSRWRRVTASLRTPRSCRRSGERATRARPGTAAPSAPAEGDAEAVSMGTRSILQIGHWPGRSET